MAKDITFVEEGTQPKVVVVNHRSYEVPKDVAEAIDELQEVSAMLKDRITEISNAADFCWNDWDPSYYVDEVLAKYGRRKKAT